MGRKPQAQDEHANSTETCSRHFLTEVLVFHDSVFIFIFDDKLNPLSIKKGYQCSHISGKTFGSSSSSLLTAAAALSWRACDALHFSLKYPQRCSVGFRLGDILGHVIVLTFVLFWQCKLDHYHDCVVLFLKAVGDILTGGILIYPQIIMMLSVNVPLCFANCSVHCGSPGEAHTNPS